jgi:hypothetical protein
MTPAQCRPAASRTRAIFVILALVAGCASEAAAVSRMPRGAVYLILALSLAARPILAQRPVDSIRIAVDRGCQLPCVDYAIVVLASGQIRIDRSDSAIVMLPADGARFARLTAELNAISIDLLPDRIPAGNAECEVVGDHSATYTVEVFRPQSVRRLVDGHWCQSIKSATFGDERTRAAHRLRAFEGELESLIQIDRWTVR